MEDFLILLLQALGEFLFELFAWWPWDCFWDWSWRSVNRPSPTESSWLAAFLSFVLGAILGGLSLFVFPAVLVKWSWLRIVLLFVSPPTSGLMSWRMAQLRQKKDDARDLTIHFWIGLCFSIGFVWTRFALAHRG